MFASIRRNLLKALKDKMPERKPVAQTQATAVSAPNPARAPAPAPAPVQQPEKEAPPKKRLRVTYM